MATGAYSMNYIFIYFPTIINIFYCIWCAEKFTVKIKHKIITSDLMVLRSE